VDRNPPRASNRRSLSRLPIRRAPTRYPLPHTLARMHQKRARGEETERAVSSAASPALLTRRSARAATAWQQLVETLLGNLLGTRVTGVRRLEQMVCARRVETGRGL